MLILIKPEYRRSFVSYLDDMYRLRHRIFKGRLGWDVKSQGETEKDAFDSATPAYLLRLDPAFNVTACVRLLPTTGPYMLRDIFPMLAGWRPLPNSPLIWESSRFATAQSDSSARTSVGLATATLELFTAMIEFGLANKLTEIVTVTDLRVERILRRASWPLQRLGEPAVIDTTMAVAGSLEVSVEALRRVRQISGIACPVLFEPVWKTSDEAL